MDHTVRHKDGRRGIVAWFRFGLRWGMMAVAALIFHPGIARADDASWIWTADHEAGQVPEGAVSHFRKTLVVQRPGEATLSIAADDAYELYLNGRRVGSGRSSRRFEEYDLSSRLVRGRNVIAVRVTNESGKTAALAVRIMVKDRQRWRSFSTDASWVTKGRPLPLWQTSFYDDGRWAKAVVLGPVGETAPWDRPENEDKEQVDRGERFAIVRGFAVERILNNEETGSLLAMTFNEFGDLLLSREGGPLLIAKDTNRDGIHDRVTTFCDDVKNCQGIIAINGDVVVTGDGPDGTAVYRIHDTNHDGKSDSVKAVVRLEVSSPEHGAHGIALGPDGMLYVVLGNHAQVDGEIATSSPYRHPYEGELVRRREDPGGHAVGVRAPGGVVLRIDLDGDSVEWFAGGIRNPYDLVFNESGDLFLYESDMESDLGMTWYQPTRMYHVAAGADLGWRSGWAKWPRYAIDTIPPVVTTGRGSPTGTAVYEHYAFPQAYHGAIFAADWSEGRILAIRLEQQGAGYKATSEVFLQGQPLNVTDLEVGPDGNLYFITGGRGTRGALYRVRWKGKIPPSLRELGRGIAPAIRQPQLNSAWGRQKIAEQKALIGPDWDRLVRGVAMATGNPAKYRTRALQLMQWYGPEPSESLLIELAQDSSERVRAKAAQLLGYRPVSTKSTKTLTRLLSDRDAGVRRAACEAMLLCGATPPAVKLLPRLETDDPIERSVARRLLERIPVDEWRADVLRSEDLRVFLVGSLALMIAEPNDSDAMAILDRCQEFLQGFVSDRDFLDMLRVMQVTIERGELPPERLTSLRDGLAEEFPCGNAKLNREMMRLLAALGATSFFDRALDYIESDIELPERVHVAMLMALIPDGWAPEQRMRLLRFFEEAQKREGGPSYAMYLLHATRDFAKNLDEENARLVLSEADRMPNAALGALYTLPKQLDAQTRTTLVQLDKKLRGNKSDAAKRLQVGICAVLARDGDELSWKYLRQIWTDEPERREVVAVAMSEKPDGENWHYLVKSLSILRGPKLQLVLRRLQQVPLAPEDSDYYRQVIIGAERLKDEGASDALALLAFWAEKDVAHDADSWKEAVAKWQDWYRETYPDGGEPALPKTKEGSKWTYDALLEYLEKDGRKEGSTVKGAVVYRKADCVKCHRFGSTGESFGPDLTSVAKRFTQGEILESVLFPSHVISSQYRSQKIALTDGRVLTGLVVPAGDGRKMVIEPSGERTTVEEDDIEETAPADVSSMPEGLLDKLTLEEIAHLFAYLRSSPASKLSRRPK